jgi:predicted adenine nucleotide alpha hydrolase (AANH) superfamily ATPase
MTKPSYEERRITKHSGSPQIADSAPDFVSDHAAKETRCDWCEIGNLPNAYGQHYTGCVYAAIVTCKSGSPEK